MTEHKTVGILGGMGPEATIDLMQRILRLTDVENEQDHIHCLIDNNPKVPSRIKALVEGQGEDPLPHVITMAKRLETAGADLLVMPCNTAHFYHQAVQDAINIPFIHMIQVVLETILKQNSIRTLGVLGSTALQITKLYEDIFKDTNLDIIYPTEKSQDELLNIIKRIKAGDTSNEIKNQYHQLAQHFILSTKVDGIIVACTELSVLGTEVKCEIFDAAEILAAKVVDLARS